MAEGCGDGEDAEGAAWDKMMVKLVALRGDPDVEAFLLEKHQELLPCAVPLDPSTGLPPLASDGTTQDEAKQAWFARKLHGHHSSDTRERRKLCKMLAKALRKFAEKYERPANSESALSAME